MNRITQHIPSFVETRDDPRKAGAFTTLDELERVPFVAGWKSEPGFVRFSLSGNALIAELAPDDEEPAGAHWVVGFIENPRALDLPQWIETPMQRERREAWNRGDEFFSWEGKRYRVTPKL
jgi:hypothetical protein